MQVNLAKNPQRGVALITALLIVALATTAAAWLTNKHQLSIRRSGNMINGDQACEYALGMEMIAIILLNEDFRDPNTNNKTDGFSDMWAGEALPFPVEGGEVTGKVIDLQGLFNLNSLYKNGKKDAKAYERFQRLLDYMQIDREIANAVIDWVDPDVTPNGTYGAEDDYYAGLEKPYRPANGPFASVSELRMVKGFDVKQFDLLSTALTVLPAATPINVNTAPKLVHIALGVTDERLAEELDQNPDKDTAENPSDPPQQPQQQQQQTRQQRQQTRMIAEFEEIGAYLDHARLPPGEKTDLGIKSNYFLFEGEARIDRGYCPLKTILYRDNSGNIRVVMRTQGTL